MSTHWWILLVGALIGAALYRAARYLYDTTRTSRVDTKKIHEVAKAKREAAQQELEEAKVVIKEDTIHARANAIIRIENSTPKPDDTDDVNAYVTDVDSDLRQ